MLDNMAELRASYIRSLADKAERMSQALSSRDFDTVRILGHQLKGSGATYGYPQLTEIGSQIEAASDSRQLTHIEALIVEFKQQVTRIQA